MHEDVQKLCVSWKVCCERGRERQREVLSSILKTGRGEERDQRGEAACIIGMKGIV